MQLGLDIDVQKLEVGKEIPRCSSSRRCSRKVFVRKSK
ncbi:hypothetical protein Gotur_030412 [Gossypium turneri]